MITKPTLIIAAACAVLCGTGLAWMWMQDGASPAPAAEKTQSFYENNAAPRTAQAAATERQRGASRKSASASAARRNASLPAEQRPRQAIDTSSAPVVAGVARPLEPVYTEPARPAASVVVVPVSPAVTALEVELPPGVQAPAVLVQDAPQPSQTQPADQENRAPSEGQKAAQQQIANQFANDLAKAAADGTATGTADGTSVDAAAWAAAQQRADEHYRLLFGDDAYNQKTIQAAREALNGP